MGSFIWIILAVGAYGTLHSLLASRRAKTLAERWLGEPGKRFYRLFFSIQAGVTFLPVLAAVFFLPDASIYTLPPPWRQILGDFQRGERSVELKLEVPQEGSLSRWISLHKADADRRQTGKAADTVILVEDIIDSGHTLNYLYQMSVTDYASDDWGRLVYSFRDGNTAPGAVPTNVHKEEVDEATLVTLNRPLVIEDALEVGVTRNKVLIGRVRERVAAPSSSASRSLGMPRRWQAASYIWRAAFWAF